MSLNEKQQALCEESRWDFSDLSALFVNCTLKRSPELSHTQGLIDISTAGCQIVCPAALRPNQVVKMVMATSNGPTSQSPHRSSARPATSIAGNAPAPTNSSNTLHNGQP